MFRRLTWWGAGFGAGLGSAILLKRALNRKVRSYVPDTARNVVRKTAKSARTNIRNAVTEGRLVMSEYQTDAETKVAGKRRSNLRAVPD